MRRTLAATTLALAMAVTGALAAAVPFPSTAAPTGRSAADPGKPADPPRPSDPAAALRTSTSAQRVLAGRPAAADASATLALRDLWLSLPGLTGTERRRADALLARPTDGVGDPFGFGYGVKAVKKCARNVCVHWVRSTTDAPPSKRWVDLTLQRLQRTWRVQTGRLGYRTPLKDDRRGGNELFDVYLKDVGSVGLYGYCAAESRVQRFLAAGYCVLDNDFAATQFPSPPRKSLKVTAAHEFFHAVQYAYDAEDDRWLMEATATWMEERVADNANDNRQYLPYGQLRDPSSPLDSYGGSALDQYGNWAFFEFLSKRFGPKVVRNIWDKMAADKKSPDFYSTQAIVKVLANRGGFAKLFAQYAAGNTIPGKSYPEGGEWPRAAIDARAVLSRSERKLGPITRTLQHLSSANYVLRPDGSLGNTSWQLEVRIAGPERKASPAAYVLIDRRRGRTERRYVKLSRTGNAEVKLGFGHRRVEKVTITLANASARYACLRRSSWSCQGRPRDDKARFALRAVLRK